MKSLIIFFTVIVVATAWPKPRSMAQELIDSNTTGIFFSGPSLGFPEPPITIPIPSFPNPEIPEPIFVEPELPVDPEVLVPEPEFPNPEVMEPELPEQEPMETFETETDEMIDEQEVFENEPNVIDTSEAVDVPKESDIETAVILPEDLN